MAMVHSIFPRTISSQISRPFIRSFAEIVAENPRRQRKLRRSQARSLAGSAPSETPEPEQNLIQKLPVREDHGLYAFFRRKSDDSMKGEDRFEVMESPDTYQVLTGMVVSAAKLCLY
jgi:large subunit ribosomal protein L47